MSRRRLAPALAALVALALSSCSSGADPGAGPAAGSAEAWGIPTNLGARYADDGQTLLPQGFNPFGKRQVTLQSRKEIVTTGLRNSSNGTGNPNFVVEDAPATALAGPVWTEADGAWSANPHASCATDLDGDGKQEVTSVVFTPDAAGTSVDQAVAVRGTAALRILRKTATGYARTTVPLPGPWTFRGWSGTLWGGYPLHQLYVDIKGGDVDGDGQDEVAVGISGVVAVYKVTGGTVRALLAPVDLRAAEATPVNGFHGTFLALGDLGSKGHMDLVVSDGADNAQADAKAVYRVYRWKGVAMEEIHKGYVANGLQSVQHATVLVGDIDDDRQDEVLFAGDFNHGTSYALLAAEWSEADQTLTFVEQGAAAAGWYQPHHGWWPAADLRLLPWHPSGAPGQGDRRNLVVAHGHILQYDPAVGFVDQAPSLGIPVSLFGENVAIGDVNQDGLEEIVQVDFTAQEYVQVFGFVAGTDGGWKQLNTNGSTWADLTSLGGSGSLVLADLDGDSQVLEFLRQELRYGDPKLEAVLASAPFYAAYGPGGSYTSFGAYQATDSTTSHSFTVEASLALGYKSETPLWGSAGERSLKVTVTGSFHYAMADSTSVSVTRTWVAYAGTDQVLVTVIPFDVYTYRLKAWIPQQLDDGSTDRVDHVGKEMEIAVPRAAEYIPMSVAAFNAIPGNPVHLGPDVLVHTVGIPGSYLTKADALALPDPGFMDVTGQTVLPADGLWEFAVEQGTSRSTDIGGGVKVALDLESTSGGVILNFGLSMAYDYTRSTTYGEGTILSSGIEGLPPTAPTSQKFDTGLVSCRRSLPGGAAGKFLLVTYWVNPSTP